MALESPYPPLHIPNVDIWDFLFERRREFSDEQVIFINPNTPRQYKFLDVKQVAISFGHALRTEWNWAKGDVVAWYSPNSIDTPALNFGVLWAGGVVTPANPAYTATELAFQLKDSGAKALVTQASCLKLAIEAAKIANIPKTRILLIGEEKSNQVQHFVDFIALAKNKPALDRASSSHTDLAYIVYSSGTTGLPKGVLLTHRNVVANTLMIRDVGLGELSWNGGPNGNPDVVSAVLPFYHIYGLTLQITFSLYAGLTAVVFPAFELRTFCKAVQDHKITFAFVVPPILLLLGKSPVIEEYDLSSVKIFFSAAAPLTLELVKAVWNRLKIPVKQGYGLSETSPGVLIQRDEDWRIRMGSVGRILPNQSIKVVAQDGSPVATGSEGELWIKGPNVFAGYHNNPKATADCMTDDGFFKTGDLGYYDLDGHFYLTERLKELIKYKGFQVAPAELEGLLVGHEKVADACVLGIYDPDQATEVPRAYVVKAEGFKNVDDATLESEIREWLEVRIAGHKKLRGGVRFVDEIPKSAPGKILRRILRDRMRIEEAEKNKSKSKL